MANVSERKSKLRSEFRRQRKKFQLEQRQNLADIHLKMAENLLSFLPKQVTTCALYRAYGSEADPHAVVEKRPDIRWVFPRVRGESLSFHNIRSESDFLLGEYGILAPGEHCVEVPLEDCQAVVVPALAYDRAGQRLGSGKGFYDRALQNFAGLCLGYGYSCQLSNEELPREPHDHLLHGIVTETEVIETARDSAVRVGKGS